MKLPAMHPRLTKIPEQPDSAGSVRGQSDEFAAGQIFLQVAARQVLARDKFSDAILKLEAEFHEQLDGDMRSKESYYGLPPTTKLPDPLNPVTELNVMNIEMLRKQAWVVSLSPEFVAAQFIHWVHTRLGDREPNPLPGLLKQMRTRLMNRYATFSANRLAESGEREVLVLLTLYFSSVVRWIDDARAALTAVALAGGPADGRRVPPLVRQHRAATRERVLDWALRFDMIEQELLCANVLPNNWRSVLDPRPADGLLGKLFGPRSHTRITDFDARRARARKEIATLRTTALASADLNRCDQLLLVFIHTRQAFDRLATDCEIVLCVGGFGKPEGKPTRRSSRRKPPDAAAGESKPPTGEN